MQLLVINRYFIIRCCYSDIYCDIINNVSLHIGKPQPYDKNITIGIADTTGIDFSTTVIAYPEPDFQLENENGTMNNRMTGSISRNAVNNFTIHLNQTVVEQRDFGSYQLKVTNLYGEARIQINVLPQSEYDTNVFFLKQVHLCKVLTYIIYCLQE